MLPDTLPEVELDPCGEALGAREVEGHALTDAQLEADTELLCDALALGLAEDDTLRVGRAVAAGVAVVDTRSDSEAHADTESVAEGEFDDESDADGLPLRCSEGLGELLAEADIVKLGGGEGLVVNDDETGALSDTVSLPVWVGGPLLEGVRDAETQVDMDAVEHADPESLGDEELVWDALALLLALTE